ncbi:suppressor of cytokine signaling 1-like [Lacerta agilis]|uniref:suppressor of cytokine signaling 1-like n=1 Tax=Lacerta agilis TaxID=80427 RepID=UPI001419F37B|nr:suppressor of cytokine signaling 1-like [Lacerta agilis]
MNKLGSFSASQRQHQESPFSPTSTRLLSHYRAFHDHEWEVVERSLGLLQASGFYWGPLSVHEAHARLLQEPVGTYLLRDSSQGNCLFSLSVRMPSGPVSLRISFRKGYFWLKEWFSDSVLRLLELVVAGTRTKPLHCDAMGEAPLVFSEPLCREHRAVPTLQELCQRTLPASSRTGQGSCWTLPLRWQQKCQNVCGGQKYANIDDANALTE